MKIIFSALLLFAAQTAFGQKIHEIKTDLLLPFVPGGHLAYEFIPEKRLGVEVEARYRWNVNGHYSNEGPISPPCPTTECESLPLFLLNQKVLTINISAKFYLLKKRSGSGPYVGAYVREDWLLSRRDPVYAYLYLPEYYVNDRIQPVQSSNLRNSIGLLAGYKFLFWKHWTLEASMGIDWDYRSLFGDRTEMDWAGIPSLKAGYRL